MASRHNGFVKKRTCWLFVIFSLLYLGIVARLVYIQVINHDQFEKWAVMIREREIAIPASRGCIYDRTGRALAINLDTASVFANMNEVEDPSRTAVQVAAILGKDSETIEERLNGGRKFIWLGRQLDSRVADKVKANSSKLPGIGVQHDVKRVYPAGSLAAQIIGFTNIDNKGIEGLERKLNKLLTGKDGRMRAELDDERRIIPETWQKVTEEENGKDVYLTIDLTIQHIAEQALARMAEKYTPESACAIVMDPDTGEILALANYPTYDANNARSVSPELWRNRVVSDPYEPGSTLKTLTVAAGLNEGMSPSATLVNCSGKERIKGGKIRCSLHGEFEDGHGAVDMCKIIQHSCNLGAAHVALRLGSKKLYEYQKAFGLFDKPESGLSGERVAYTAPPDKWRAIRLANIGFGQGIAATPLQMASIYATIANGGKYVQPRIVREVRTSDGKVVEPFEPKVVRRVIKKEVADQVTRMLVRCAEDGTGQPALIDGRTVAGKTGSAQIALPGGKGYASGQYVASFMGFVPAYNPRLVIAVVVNKPHGSHWGATVAAPVFQEIGEKALWYLRVPADVPTESKPEKRPSGDHRDLA